MQVLCSTRRWSDTNQLCPRSGMTKISTTPIPRKIAEYVESLSDETENEWYATVERCAATKSNDMATFPLFGEFLVLLSKHKPEMAERFLLRANDDVLNFLAA